MVPVSDIYYHGGSTFRHKHHLAHTEAVGSLEDALVDLTRRTKTVTETITSTIYTETPTIRLDFSQTFQWPSISALSDVVYTTDFPKIHGIVPGALPNSRYDSHSPSLSWPTGPQFAAPTTTELESGSRHSNYPYPSPPGSMYSTSIVPTATHKTLQHLAQHTGSMQRTSSSYYPTPLGRIDYELTYLPQGIKLLFLATLLFVVLGFAWALIVWLTNFPPGAWGIWNSSYDPDRTYRQTSKERRPLDKPSKYAPRSSRAMKNSMANSPKILAATHPSSHHLHVDEAITSAYDDETIELRVLPQQRSSARQPEQSFRDHIYTEHRRTASNPSKSLHLHTPVLPCAISNPPNPYLQPPNIHLAPPTPGDSKIRTSSEWLTERAVFFSSSTPAPAPSLHTSSLTSAAYSLNTHDIEAQEAGTALLRHSRSRSYDSSVSGESMLRRSLSWLDQGLGMVDDAVSRVAGGISKWTDDEGGEEGLLLPVVNGKGKVD